MWPSFTTWPFWRVADYLQIDSARAPYVLLQLRRPQSPLSVAEWNKHRAVANLSWCVKDPQSIKVEVNEQHSLATHLQVAELLDSLQAEMDVSLRRFE